MYIMNKRYTVSVARERLADALDEAEQGVPVIIERRGVRFRLAIEEPKRKKRAKTAPRIEILDPAIAEGEWTWEWKPESVSLEPRRRP